MNRLAIITTHPIQYNAPLFRLLTERKKLQVKVFYTWGKSVTKNKYDPGFGLSVDWDIPLMQGYDYVFVKNISPNPGSHSFNGIDNPHLIAEITAWKANALLVYGWCFKSHLQSMRHFRNKIPVLFRGDSTLIDKQPFLKNFIRTIFLRWVYCHIDYALYTGTNNKLYFKKCGVPENKLVFAPHAIDNTRFANDSSKQYEHKAQLWRNELGIAETDIVFLFAGKLEPKKSPSLLIETFIALQQPGIQLVIAGNGILEKELVAKFAENTSIKFIGFQNQSRMPILYRLANCFVLPSKGPNETWGLSVNEALASSRPVIVSSNCGCAIDLIQEGKNGYIFNSGKPNDLLRKMNTLIEQIKRGNNMNEAAFMSIQEWNFSEICKQVEQLTA